MTGKSLPGLPAPFENAYFRERSLKAAARQKQGHILVSGAKPDNGQGLPLPYIHDVPSLRRGSYDYECEWGRFKYEYDLSAYLFTPHNGQVPPGWEHYDLQTPIQPVTAVIDHSRRLAAVKTPDREIVLRDVPMSGSPYNLLQQINAPWRRAASLYCPHAVVLWIVLKLAKTQGFHQRWDVNPKPAAQPLLQSIPPFDRIRR